jgi:hypothetical protein
MAAKSQQQTAAVDPNPVVPDQSDERLVPLKAAMPLSEAHIDPLMTGGWWTAAIT